MIKVYNQIPEYYYKESRDFQLIGRLFESVFNHAKMSTDFLTNIPLSKDTDPALIDLVTKTVGFESRRRYDFPNLLALTKAFKDILKIKGTKKSIEDCIRLLLNAQNIKEEFDVVINTETTIGEGSSKIYSREVLIYIPQAVRDIALLEDLLDYVLPAGFIYEIITANISSGILGAEAVSVDSLEYTEHYPDNALGVVTPGLITLNLNELENISESSEGEEVYKGVLDNTVIIKPSFEE